MKRQRIEIARSNKVESEQISEGGGTQDGSTQELSVIESNDVHTRQIVGKEGKEETTTTCSEILENICHEGLRDSAEKVREYSQRLLDAAWASDDHFFRFFTNHASLHSQMILKRLKELLFETRLKNDYEYYLLYTAAYAHDLGMLPQKTNGSYEDYTREDVVVQARKNHLTRSYAHIKANWREMGILGETESKHLAVICRAHGSKEDLQDVNESAQCLISGKVSEIRWRFLAALTRLADGLDLEHRRIPPEFITSGAPLSEEAIREYIAHGSVQKVSISHKDRKIYIELLFKKKRLHRDVIETMKQHVVEEFGTVQETLQKNGVDLRGVEFLETSSG